MKTYNKILFYTADVAGFLDVIAGHLDGQYWSQDDENGRPCIGAYCEATKTDTIRRLAVTNRVTIHVAE